MFYLITDQENKTWRNIQWGENVTHSEDNPNYHFAVYNNPQTATYLYPFYEEIKSPKIWIASGHNPSKDEGFRTKFSQLITEKELIINFPSNEQRITFAILCAMNLVLNPIFRKWAINYMNGNDQTQETARKTNEKLVMQAGQPLDQLKQEYQYVSCAHPVLGAAMRDDPVWHSAAAAHRAYQDSLELPEPINLEQTAQIVNMLPALEIAQLLE